MLRRDLGGDIQAGALDQLIRAHLRARAGKWAMGPTRLTAAHRTVPLGTRLRVSDPASGRSVTVLVNDRWGGGPGRVVNLSRRAADELGMGTPAS